MVGRTKKQKILSAIFIVLFVSIVAFGIVNYSYNSLSSVETTTQNTKNETDEDESFLHTYMETIYDRLQNGN